MIRKGVDTTNRNELSHCETDQCGKKKKLTFSRAPASATTPVQRGTNRPSGKMKKKVKMAVLPRNDRTTATHAQAEEPAAPGSTIPPKAIPPPTTSVRETKRAMRSSGLRQKMTVPVASQTMAEINLAVTRYAA